MEIRIRSSEEQFAIYREGLGVFVYAISLAVGCAAFGALFIFKSDGSKFPLALGGFFIVVAALLLAALPKWFRRIKHDNGAMLLVADKAGLSIAPTLGKPSIEYSWADVSQIVLAKKLVEKRVAEKALSENQVIVYFRDDNADEEKHLWKSPLHRSFSAIDFPKGEAGRVKDELVRFFGAGDVQVVSNAIFDYANSKEIFQP